MVSLTVFRLNDESLSRCSIESTRKLAFFLNQPFLKSLSIALNGSALTLLLIFFYERTDWFDEELKLKGVLAYILTSCDELLGDEFSKISPLSVFL